MIDIADSPLAAWRAALSTPDLGVALCALVVGLGIPELLPQHVRPPPEYKLARPHGESAYVPSPLLLEPYIPDAQQAVPEAALWLLCVLIPFSIALALSFAAPGRGAVRAWLLGYIWTMALQGLIIGCIKKYVGYWRPYYYAECGWDEKTGLCANPAAAAGDAVRSFPSGHAGASMAALLHVSLRLLGAARLSHAGAGPRSPRGSEIEPPSCHVDLTELKMLAALGPAMLALWVGASRIFDNDHHPADVVAGSLIGGGCAALFYFRHFPSVFDSASHLPRAVAQAHIDALMPAGMSDTLMPSVGCSDSGSHVGSPR